MSLNWKKLATYESGGSKIEGDITGVAHGGIDGILSIDDGGTGSNLQNGSLGQILMMGNNGAEWAPAPDSAGLILSSDGQGSWDWYPINTSHDHDAQYLNINSDTTQTMSGSFHVDGTLEITGSVAFAEISDQQAATVNNGLLGNGGGSGDNCGWFIDIDGLGETTPEADDPAVVWKSSLWGEGGGWTAGKYSTGMRAIQTFYTDGYFDPESHPASVTTPGVWAQDASGNLYMSVKA